MVWLVLLLTVALQTQVAKPAQPSAVVAPDRFWCPMHPNVRSPVEGTCPICKMTLVGISAPTVGEYRVEVVQLPAARGSGLSGLQFAVSPPGSFSLVDSFTPIHDKPLHVFIVSRDLSYFAHVHPEFGHGTWDVRHDVPAGEYMVVADFVPIGGTPQTVQRAIVTPGYNPPAISRLVEPRPTGGVAVVAGDVSVTMSADDLRAGKPATLTFAVSDSKSRTPVTDLEPYLAAPAHALLVSSDLTFAAHGHPEAAATTGPAVSFEFLMPTPGLYKLWLQVQRRGRVLTLPFVVEVK